MNNAVRLSILPAVVSACLMCAATAGAATYTVTSTADEAAIDPAVNCLTVDGSCTLRSAVQAADAAGGANTIVLAGDTYTLTIPPSGSSGDAGTGDLDVTGGQLTISGAGASATTIDANQIDRAFTVADGASLALDDVTVTGGRPGGTGGQTTCPAFEDAGGDGGAILQYGTLSLTNDVITGNLAPTSGGAIADEANGSSPGPLTITSSTISDNLACGSGFPYGGGVYENSGQPVTINTSTFTGNQVPAGAGGAIAEEAGATMSITDSTLSGNTAANGGALDTEGIETPGTVTLTGDTLSGNSAVPAPNRIEAAAVRPALIAAPQIKPVTQPAVGGAISTYGDSDTLVNTTVTGNSATDGGAIASGFGTTTLSFSTIDANTASGSTFSAQDFGVSTGGNLENIGSGSFVLDDTIVADGSVPNGGSTDCNGASGFTSDGHNLFDSSDAGAQCGAVASDLNAGPNLGALANNGGPTQTEALLSGSPAIDAADDGLCTKETAGIDQRGITRPQGTHCDIGAYEAQASAPPTVTSPPSPTPTPAPAPPPAPRTVTATDLALSAHGTPGHLDRGRRTTLTFTVTNRGPDTDTAVVLTIPLPSALKWAAYRATGGPCSGHRTVRCTLGTLAAGASDTVRIVVTATRTGRIRTPGHVTGQVAEANLVNNAAHAMVTVVEPPCRQNLAFATAWRPGVAMRTVKVYVDGRLTQTRHGANLRSIRIRPLPRTGAHSVTVTFSAGPLDTVAVTRSYNGCSNGSTTYAYPPQTDPGAS